MEQLCIPYDSEQTSLGNMETYWLPKLKSPGMGLYMHSVPVLRWSVHYSLSALHRLNYQASHGVGNVLSQRTSFHRNPEVTLLETIWITYPSLTNHCNKACLLPALQVLQFDNFFSFHFFSHMDSSFMNLCFSCHSLSNACNNSHIVIESLDADDHFQPLPIQLYVYYLYVCLFKLLQEQPFHQPNLSSFNRPK